PPTPTPPPPPRPPGGPWFLLGPDLLLGARDPVVLLDGDQLGLHRLQLDVELRRLAIDLGEPILHRVLVLQDPLVGRGEVVELPLEAVTLDGDAIERLALLGREG